MKKLLIIGAGIAGISLFTSDSTVPSSSPAPITAPIEIQKEKPKAETVSTKKVEAKKEIQCHPSYSGCLNPNASDYDCAGGSGNGPYYTGKVQVLGSDVFDLDRDGDGWGCEK